LVNVLPIAIIHVDVNDGTSLNMWQDVSMTGSVKPQDLAPLRVVDDLDTVRVLADPLRLAILRVVMREAHVKPRLMTVKEIAEELGEPQTKLYRHIKQLESVGVIRDAETRLVSGILEHRYQPGQVELRIDGSVLGTMSGEDAGTSVAAVFDGFRDHFVKLIRTGEVRLWPSAEEGDRHDDYTRSRLASMSTRISPAKAAEFHARLSALFEEFENTERDEDGVDVNLFGAWFVPDQP
jgi:DNA-binding transcriptional ArsR family regulator